MNDKPNNVYPLPVRSGLPPGELLIPGPEPKELSGEELLLQQLEMLSELDEFLWNRRKPGVLLRRPYPPMHAPWIRSRQGGLPMLPPEFEWPYGVDYGKRQPMHFLAQIDCAELPCVDPRFPKQGMLFFFAVNAEEQILDRKNPLNSIRVYYAPHVPDNTPLRTPPDDIRPLFGVEAEDRPFWPEWLLPGEAGPTLLPAWPLWAGRIDTWPDYESLDAEPPNVSSDFYVRRVAELRAGAVVAAAGVPTTIHRFPPWEVPVGAGKRFPQSHLGLGDDFPCVGIIIDRIARAVGRHRIRGRSATSIGDDVLPWVDRAATIGWEEVPSDKDRSEFRAWLLGLVREDEENGFSRYDLGTVITTGVRHSITLAGGSSKIASLIPEALYRALESRHLPIDQRLQFHPVAGHNWNLRARVNQVLGFPELLHGSIPGSGSEMLCLLQLTDDYSIDWRFGDGGQATFWIDADDLLHRRFDRVFGIVESH